MYFCASACYLSLGPWSCWRQWFCCERGCSVERKMNLGCTSLCVWALLGFGEPGMWIMAFAWHPSN